MGKQARKIARRPAADAEQIEEKLSRMFDLSVGEGVGRVTYVEAITTLVRFAAGEAQDEGLDFLDWTRLTRDAWERAESNERERLRAEAEKKEEPEKPVVAEPL